MPPVTTRRTRPTANLPLGMQRQKPAAGGMSRLDRGAALGTRRVARNANPYAAPTVNHRRRGRSAAGGGLAATLGWLSIAAFGIYIVTIAIAISVIASGDFASLANNLVFFVIGGLMIFVGLVLGIAGCMARGKHWVPLIGLLLNGIPFIISLANKIANHGH